MLAPANSRSFLDFWVPVFLPGVGDVLFVDAVQQNYRLMRESPAADIDEVGSSSDLVQWDLRNQLRDSLPDAGV